MAAIAGTLWWAVNHYTGRVDRIPNVFPSNVPADAKPDPGKGGQTFLLVGLDARSDLPTTGKDAKAAQWKPGAQRSDTMMLVHLPADNSSAYVISLPRDSWVPVPGHGKAKLNAAFSWGGPPLLIDTVQRLTKVEIDHLAVIDWNGFKKLTDSVGGVDLSVNGVKEHMSGDEALKYVRERKNLPRGDLDRTLRQQNYLRAVLSKTLSSGSLTNPLKTKELLDRVTETVSVDDRFSDGELRDLAWNMRSLRTSDMVFMNAPVSGTGMVEGQSVVHLDKSKSTMLWKAINADTVDDYVANNDVDRLGANPR
ncbi:LCP family protein [Streptomyces sp. N35]|uniref:LCP family protein n=1 Tax=Streptomyces sp. N35 TaxID=2795730 RepID=UPI0027DD0D97|nr:LCP family protein [Streptomyces sp. N35]